MLSSRQVSSQGASTSGRQPAGLPITSRTLSRHQPYLNTTHNDCRNTAIQLLRSPPAVKATGSDSVSDSAPVEQLPEEESEPEDNATVPEATDDELFPTIQFNLPNPVNVKVHTAEYIISSVKVQDCPAPRYPEFAVIGRSNVGKSSLINMLTQRRELALVSKQPGKTKCINHFIINDSWYFVDLPGYGYAKVGAEGRETFDRFTREYFTTRPNLAMVFLLIDGSIPPQKIDLAYANWLTDNEVPFAIAFTKVDKRRKGAVKSTVHVDAFKRALLQDLAYLPPSIVTSAAAGIGKGEMLRLIASLRVAFVASGRLQAIRQGAIPAGHLRGPLSRQDQQDQQQQQEGEQQQEQQQSDASSAAGIPGAGKEQPAVQGTQTSRGSQGQGTSRGGKAGAGSAPAAAASGAKQPAGRKGAQPTRGSQAQTKGPAGKPQSPGQRQAPGSAQKGAKPKAKVQ